MCDAGDSRAVLCRAGKAVRLTQDHTPSSSPELSRVREAGGTVILDGAGHLRVLEPPLPPGLRACRRPFGTMMTRYRSNGGSL